MSLKDRITEDMKAAMRARDAARLSAIRMLQAAIKQKEVDERIVADDAAGARHRREADQAAQGLDRAVREGGPHGPRRQGNGRDSTCCPATCRSRCRDAELAAAIDAAIAESGAAGPQGMGKVMARAEAAHRRPGRHGQGLRAGEAAPGVTLPGRRPVRRGAAPKGALARIDPGARASARPVRTLSSTIMIPQGFIQDLLARVDIVDVVGRYVQLKKAGQNLLGLCPFHGEKTPSFTVSPSKQFFHCFGCGAHGSAIGFLMEHRGLGLRGRDPRTGADGRHAGARGSPRAQARRNRRRARSPSCCRRRRSSTASS